MLQLKVNSELVDLGSNPQITIDEESPVFEKDSIPGGFGFPFSLPVTDRNRRILQFPERIEKRDPMTIDQDFELYHSGLLRSSGTITVTEADESYRAYLAVGSGNFSSKIQGKKLKDIDFGGERTWGWKNAYNQPIDDFTIFPVYNPNFMDETEFPVTWEGNKNRLNSYENGDWFKNTDTTMAISPYPFLGYVIKRILNEFGFSIRMNIFATDQDLASLVIYSNYDIAQVTTTTSNREINFFDGMGREVTKTITVTEISRILDKFDLVDSMPDMEIGSFIKSLRNLFNIAFVFDKNNNVDIVSRKDLILSSDVTDITSQALGNPKVVSISPPDGFLLSWSHDEDDTLFSEKFKDILDHLENLKDPVADYAELEALTPELNEIRYIEEWDLYMQYAAEIDPETEDAEYLWQIFSIGYQNFWTGEREEQFSTDFSTLVMGHYERLSGGVVIKCPWTQQLSNSLIRPEKTPFSPRLLFYRGMIEMSDANFYPMGSNDNLTFYENKISWANLTMRWDGEYGRYNQLFKDYLTWWMKRKQVNRIIQDPSVLDFCQKYAIDRNHYLLKKRTINFSLHQITPGECEWYLV